MESPGSSRYANGVSVYQEIGRRVSALRRERGLTQEALAERAGTSAPYIARIEAGDRRPTIDVLAAVARSLDVPLWRLFASTRLTGQERGEVATRRELADALAGLDDQTIRLLVEVARRMRR